MGRAQFFFHRPQYPPNISENKLIHCLLPQLFDGVLSVPCVYKGRESEFNSISLAHSPVEKEKKKMDSEFFKNTHGRIAQSIRKEP